MPQVNSPLIGMFHQLNSNWCKQVIWRLQDLFFYNSDYWLLMIVLIFRYLKPWQLQYSYDLLQRLWDCLLRIPEDRDHVPRELCPVPHGRVCVNKCFLILIIVITADHKTHTQNTESFSLLVISWIWKCILSLKEILGLLALEIIGLKGTS